MNKFLIFALLLSVVGLNSSPTYYQYEGLGWRAITEGEYNAKMDSLNPWDCEYISHPIIPGESRKCSVCMGYAKCEEATQSIIPNTQGPLYPTFPVHSLDF